MKRFRVLTAALCAAVLLCGFTPATAYAGGGEDWEGLDPVEPAVTEEPVIEPGEGFSEDGNLVTRDLLYDKHTNKQFITVQTSGGATFYIVIDYDKPVDEDGEQYQTYFLNTVDEADLLAAAEAAGVELASCSCSDKCAAGAVNTDCAVCAVSMTYNAALAGLVGITAGCDAVSPLGAAVMGIVFGLVIVLAVEFFDKVAKIDDPVGAISVHGVCGALGTILTGLFATGVSTEKGVFYGGGFHFFGVQCLGVASVILYVAVVITIVFAILKHTIGLRVTPEEEITGLDVSEHGLLTAYASFAMLPDTAAVETDAPAAVIGDVPAAEAIPVKHVPSFDTADGTAPKFTKVEIICKESKFEALKTAMLELGITGMTMSHVLGCGIQKGKPEYYRGVEVEPTLLPKIQLDIVVSKVPVRSVIETAKKVLYTGHIGDGKIFVYDVENVVKVRTGEEGYDALQDVE